MAHLLSFDGLIILRPRSHDDVICCQYSRFQYINQSGKHPNKHNHTNSGASPEMSSEILFCRPWLTHWLLELLFSFTGVQSAAPSLKKALIPPQPNYWLDFFLSFWGLFSVKWRLLCQCKKPQSTRNTLGTVRGASLAPATMFTLFGLT